MRNSVQKTRLKVLDLFSGIGGFSLGLERTGGFQTVAFCDIEPFSREILARRWAGVPIYSDVREIGRERLERDGIAVDVICGGFPCQDISNVGHKAGIGGARSGLWAEMCRLTCELRPSYLIVENVSALTFRGLGRVLGDLAEIGFDAEWHCIPASAVGAHHRRDRIWIVAYPNPATRGDLGGDSGGSGGREVPCDSGSRGGTGCSGALADPDGNGLPRRGGFQYLECEGDPHRLLPHTIAACHQSVELGISGWAPEPEMGRMAHGLPRQLDRLKALGNAVVPQLPELLGRAILARERRLEGGCDGLRIPFAS